MILSVFTASANLISAESVAASRACARTPWSGRMPGNGAAPCTFHLASRALLHALRAAVCALRAVLPFVVLGHGLQLLVIAVRNVGEGSGAVDRGVVAAAPVDVDHLDATQTPVHCSGPLRHLEDLVQSPRRERNDR
jgi:hypothetical protein